ncbi:MAG: YggS family pyridoxal phosphate-dependent enzyme [bacterium]|nr:YggS family pyridoxal phosphate-dependent enzyme [bacterium]
MTPTTRLSCPLRQNLERVEERIALAARRAQRSPTDVRLLPVTKSVTTNVAADLVGLGQQELAEARAGLLEEKAIALDALGLAVRWHFIGHLQRNKAARVVRRADVIHSVDSVRLLETIERVAPDEGRRPALYLQVNRTSEAQKHGMDTVELREALALARSCEHVTFVGLMAMGPLVESPGHGALEVFSAVVREARTIEADPESAAVFEGGRCRLSMGMSGDLEAAIEAGTDLVRVGGALFVESHEDPPPHDGRRRAGRGEQAR